eukprot:jgi/Mesvir1/16557/Mv10098-RA.1
MVAFSDEPKSSDETGNLIAPLDSAFVHDAVKNPEDTPSVPEPATNHSYSDLIHPILPSDGASPILPAASSEPLPVKKNEVPVERKFEDDVDLWVSKGETELESLHQRMENVLDELERKYMEKISDKENSRLTAEGKAAAAIEFIRSSQRDLTWGVESAKEMFPFLVDKFEATATQIKRLSEDGLSRVRNAFLERFDDKFDSKNYDAETEKRVQEKYKTMQAYLKKRIKNEIEETSENAGSGAILSSAKSYYEKTGVDLRKLMEKRVEALKRLAEDDRFSADAARQKVRAQLERDLNFLNPPATSDAKPKSDVVPHEQTVVDAPPSDAKPPSAPPKPPPPRPSLKPTAPGAPPVPPSQAVTKQTTDRFGIIRQGTRVVGGPDIAWLMDAVNSMTKEQLEDIRWDIYSNLPPHLKLTDEEWDVYWATKNKPKKDTSEVQNSLKSDVETKQRTQSDLERYERAASGDLTALNPSEKLKKEELINIGLNLLSIAKHSPHKYLDMTKTIDQAKTERLEILPYNVIYKQTLAHLKDMEGLNYAVDKLDRTTKSIEEGSEYTDIFLTPESMLGIASALKDVFKDKNSREKPSNLINQDNSKNLELALTGIRNEQTEAYQKRKAEEDEKIRKEAELVRKEQEKANVAEKDEKTATGFQKISLQPRQSFEVGEEVVQPNETARKIEQMIREGKFGESSDLRLRLIRGDGQTFYENQVVPEDVRLMPWNIARLARAGAAEAETFQKLVNKEIAYSTKDPKVASNMNINRVGRKAMRLYNNAHDHIPVQRAMRRKPMPLYVSARGKAYVVCPHADDTVTVLDINKRCELLARYNASGRDISPGLDKSHADRTGGVLIKIGPSRFAYVGAKTYEFATIGHRDIIDFFADGGRTPLAVDEGGTAYDLKDLRAFDVRTLGTAGRDEYVRMYSERRAEIPGVRFNGTDMKGDSGSSYGMLNTTRKDIPITNREHFAKQFVPVPNSGGGDCFYLALAQADHLIKTGRSIPDDDAREVARKMRRTIVDGFPPEVEEYVVQQERWQNGDAREPAGEILRRYRSAQSREGEFAERPEILAAAALLRRPIVVHRVTPGTTVEHRETFGEARLRRSI